MPAFTQTGGIRYGVGVSPPATGCCRTRCSRIRGRIEGYLASEKIAIAVAVTYQPEAFDAQGIYANQADILFRKIGALVAPDDAPPVKK